MIVQTGCVNLQPILIRANKRNSISIAVGKNEYQFEYTKANIVSAQLTNYMKSMNNSTIERLPNCSIMMDDWNKSLYFVSNLNKYSKRQTSDHNSYERAYKIKNLLKALPTYANMIDNDICIRCEKEVEDWDHIWICEAIEFREWELLRGVYNNRFNKITNDKDERKVIFSLWVYCYEELKNKFGEKVHMCPRTLNSYTRSNQTIDTHIGYLKVICQ
ncbi:hypothetical protein GLOIN_2v1476761 [Rhizophagus irregularis DAOM 181602=DAOM 197198]|uniref:Uncharacterized protein n=3 Tax=Rhizophagus irregularis TaxID=588596 RepID=A0A2P4Q7U2_RHIID|nr:hypothetical protein GLOIN_2v1476761 [Rhizophagus irregularis DAOM 181602=DAOM 197198]POG73699.1 hypothetical protein GLOIN_2v1476761 [Rhizophagus irregularis DAOM 181602=DAOM 197198]|eukprot:XP_025180565.1 hypothetical protein GLOIN_2v1476761 [Rhizophagus irregularis DAOM 181602=DAOM 197198]